MRTRLGIVLGALLLAASCSTGPQGSIERDFDLRNPQLSERGGQATARVVVGSKDFAEQEILGHVTVLALQAAGVEVVDRIGLGGTEDVRSALLDGDIDMYWEYTGTGWLIQLAQSGHPGDPAELYRNLAELDLDENAVAWLTPAPADNTYAIAVRDDVEDPALAAVETVSDLGRLVAENPGAATLCVGPEFGERADGLPGLEQSYGFEVPQAQVAVVPDDTVYGAVDAGETCTFGSVFETNGLVDELGLRLLTDDRDFFAPYQPALTMRQETLDRFPRLSELVAPIAERLDTATLRELSAEVLVRDATPEDVAEQWMRENGFIA